MNPKIALEIFGYIGTALIIVSMMMKSIHKLRLINVCGSVISTIYAVFCDAWPIVVMNVCLMTINVFHLIRYAIDKKKSRSKEEHAADADINTEAAE